MIWKQLRVTAIWALANGVFVLLIPRDPKNALFLGLSASRLAMVVGFALLAALAAAAAHYIRIKPAFAHRLEKTFTPVTRVSFFKKVLPPVATLIILVGLYNLSEWFATTDDYRKALLLRVLPVTLFAAGLGVQVLALELFRRSRLRWSGVIVLTMASSIGSRLLQGGLLNSIVRPYIHDPELVQQSQIFATLAAFLLLAILSGRSRRAQVTWGWITILLLVLYLIQWVTFPAKYWESLRDLALAGPLIVFGGALVIHTIFDFWDRAPAAARPGRS